MVTSWKWGRAAVERMWGEGCGESNERSRAHGVVGMWTSSGPAVVDDRVEALWMECGAGRAEVGGRGVRGGKPTATDCRL